MSNLYSSLVAVKGDRKELLAALANLSSFDCDFNGENGVEYAWEETKEKGFESNLEYLLDKVKGIYDDIECVIEFFRFWMEKDKKYYKDYIVRCLTDENAKISVIAFSAIKE